MASTSVLTFVHRVLGPVSGVAGVLFLWGGNYGDGVCWGYLFPLQVSGVELRQPAPGSQSHTVRPYGLRSCFRVDQLRRVARGQGLTSRGALRLGET